MAVKKKKSSKILHDGERMELNQAIKPFVAFARKLSLNE